MKKVTYLMIGASVVVIGLMAVSWAQMNNSSKTVVAPVAPAPTMRPAIPAAPQVATIPLVTAPTAARPVTPAAQAPVAAKPVVPQAATPQIPATPQLAAPITAPTSASADLKADVENQYKDKLSFPLTEAKMIAFAQAAIKVEKINEKWDVQIAGAPTDQMAIEYNNFAVEEISEAMKSMPGITLPEFNEMTQLTASDPSFNRVFVAYKELVKNGSINTPKAAQPSVTASPQPSSALPKNYVVTPVQPKTSESHPAVSGGLQAAPGSNTVTPPAAPVNSGTAPAPVGSPAPPYSQPSTR